MYTFFIYRDEDRRVLDKFNRVLYNDITVLDSLIKSIGDNRIVIVDNNYKDYIDYTIKYPHIQVFSCNEVCLIDKLKKAAACYKSDNYFILSDSSGPISKEHIDKLYSGKDSNYDVVKLSDTPHNYVKLYTHKGIFKMKGTNIDYQCYLNYKYIPFGDKPTNTFVKLTIDTLADVALHKELYNILENEYCYDNILKLAFNNHEVFKLNLHVLYREFNIREYIAIITEGDEIIGQGHVARSIAMHQYYSEVLGHIVRIYIKDNKESIKLLERWGYIKNLDYIIGLPVETEDEFKNWKFIRDTYAVQTLDFKSILKFNPTFGVNMRLIYSPYIVTSSVVVTFGKGKFRRFGEKIYNDILDKDKFLIDNVDNIAPFILGAERIITMFSQSCREAIFLGKTPEVYSYDELTDELAEEYNKKGYIKWLGNINE